MCNGHKVAMSRHAPFGIVFVFVYLCGFVFVCLQVFMRIKNCQSPLSKIRHGVS